MRCAAPVQPAESTQSGARCTDGNLSQARLWGAYVRPPCRQATEGGRKRLASYETWDKGTGCLWRGGAQILSVPPQANTHPPSRRQCFNMDRRREPVDKWQNEAEQRASGKCAIWFS